MDETNEQQGVTDASMWHDCPPEPRKRNRKFTVKTMLPHVCGAVIHLREPKGCSPTQILKYLKSEDIVEDSHLPLIENALKKSVRRAILQEISDGKYMLVHGDCQTIQKLIEESCNKSACCPNKKVKSRPSCKKRKPACPKKKRCRKAKRRRSKKRSCQKKCRKPWIPSRCKRAKKCDDESQADDADESTETLSEAASDTTQWN